MKQAEREEVWARVDAQAESVFKDDASMKGFLNFMANCTPQSTRNLLILYEQTPEITHPRTFDKWKEAGRSIRSGEKGYTFFADQEYTKEDGSIGTGYTLTKAYDISQTRGPQPLPPQKHLPEEIIAAMVEQSPVPLAISDQLPQGVQAQYVPKQHTIFVRNGMDETATICAIAREPTTREWKFLPCLIATAPFSECLALSIRGQGENYAGGGEFTDWMFPAGAGYGIMELK